MDLDLTEFGYQPPGVVDYIGLLVLEFRLPRSSGGREDARERDPVGWRIGFVTIRSLLNGRISKP